MSIPGGFCITECVIDVGNKAGDIGSYVGVRIVTRTTGDRRVTDEGSSLVKNSEAGDHGIMYHNHNKNIPCGL